VDASLSSLNEKKKKSSDNTIRTYIELSSKVSIFCRTFAFFTFIGFSASRLHSTVLMSLEFRDKSQVFHEQIKVKQKEL